MLEPGGEGKGAPVSKGSQTSGASRLAEKVGDGHAIGQRVNDVTVWDVLRPLKTIWSISSDFSSSNKLPSLPFTVSYLSKLRPQR